MEQISKVVKYEFSETDDFVDITSRLSYLNDYNANGFRLLENKDSNITEKSVKSLINTPVVAYYNHRTNDFEGHKVIKTKEGIKFGTQAVGTHIDAWIQNDKVIPIYSEEEIELPCIYGKARIWASRFPKFYNVLKKRLEKGKMYTSWELNPVTLFEDEIENSNIPDPRSSDEWVFLGNCLLGSSPPAYGETSKVLEISSADEIDMEMSEALTEDIQNISSMGETEQIISINEGGQEDMSEKNKKNETSAITQNDLYNKVRKAINSIDEDKYFYISMIYPYDYKAVAYVWGRQSEEDFIEFSYTINSDDTVSITGQQDVKMRFIPVTELESQLSELQEKLSATEKEVAEAGKSITELTKEKEFLETQISELTQYKEKVEEMEAAERERELASKKDELKSFALEDELITSEELETDEQLSTIFSELTLENYELSQEKIEVIKGRRAIQKFKENKISSQETIETSQVKTQPKVKTDLNSGNEDGVLTAKDIVLSMLGKKN